MVYITPLPSQTHPDNPVTAIFSKNGYILLYLFNIHMYKPNFIFHNEIVNSDYPKAGGKKIILKNLHF